MKYELTMSNFCSFDKNVAKELGFKFDPDGDLLYTFEQGYEPVFVEFATIDDLTNFVKEHGRVVITETTVEIYNGCRE